MKLPPVSNNILTETNSPECRTSILKPVEDFRLRILHLKLAISQTSAKSEAFRILFCLVEASSLLLRWIPQNYQIVSAEIELQYLFRLHTYLVSWCILNLGRPDRQELDLLG